MMDTQKDIRDAIRAVLPGLSQEVLAALEDVLEKLGTTTTDDFQYITERDLLPVLKPIQARRLVAAWAQNNSMASTSGGASSSPQSVQSSQSAASLSQPSSAATSSPFLSCSPVLPTWVDSFQIPWQKLPEELIQTLERQKRPSARLRRQMVRIIVSEMMLICKNPTKRNTTEIAERMVSRYPKSLKDVIDGDVIGLGYHSLVKQLQARIENVKRQDTPKITKRKAESDNDTDEIPAEQKASVQDTYGCVNWAPKFLPLSETVESQLKKKEDMKKMFKDKKYAAEDVKELIKSTYYTQRKDINKGTSILKLCQEWPFLFHETGMAEHFQQLTGISLMEAFFTNLDKKGERIVNFLKTVFAQKEKQVLESLLKLASEKGQSSGCTEMILLLLAFFGEKEEHMFHYVEKTSLAEEVEMEDVPATPCLIVCGMSEPS
ncbi:uncharacterized protein LOC116722746 isoform X2 [Xiphophorus hellerii]|uniref:uncharacterized protein LOC116719259 isoform X2 n=1 Tax=Xiphophorus hellerii TaxID=8084 RepID=UPI0013B45C9A|nr:uncharacterized protein LOC116719259 isoform X2 [Xiphophorus hellerii]XP_032417637.1 uncharacterized protein LOC116719259 isoform X2 [Xiphophorus hellerii]XP_032417638.1 uncharacterized protein LOC116719259 isoform X2 [Xiphophorus hellerii]XP_032422900.1 uncharacterized protein LOC116722746 isoform X2 [Xiphophorus hellerii]XP_032422901.1 uncharacterized protein LOC116722746 isoform X2 [Xiphophorus hellerii]XP_032422902.1 uncharacterized protein LOC116722746 isoform X2 [Xiphophorus hellerii]